MTTKKFKRQNYYQTIGNKPNFYRKIKDKEHKTNQDELERASISIMAEKYGIDAIMSKAEKMYIDNLSLQDELYGHDMCNMTSVKENLLNNKNKLKRLFERIPARIRKTIFNDNIGEFLNSYTSGDEKKLTELSKYGLVSEKQLDKLKTFKKEQEKIKLEEQNKIKFAELMKNKEQELYETFKKTGNISISNQSNNTTNNENV